MANILCIDDEPHVANLRCMALEAGGHRATPAWTMTDVMHLLRGYRFEVVVVGMQAGATGPVICREAKAAAGPPFVIVTGYRQDEESSGESCADLHFEKVVDPESLVTIINALLRGEGPKLACGRSVS